MSKHNSQPGFFDMQHRQKKLLNTRDFLDRVRVLVDWEAFRPTLDAALNRSKREAGGRPAHDCVLMFRILVLQALYNLSDEQTEYQILDRLSFMNFLNLSLHETVPDARSIWLFREALIAAKSVEKLFNKFDIMLAESGFAASGGQIIDATFVEVPRQRNRREENDIIKKGSIPAGWSDKKRAHKDVDARWTKKNNINLQSINGLRYARFAAENRAFGLDFHTHFATLRLRIGITSRFLALKIMRTSTANTSSSVVTA